MNSSRVPANRYCQVELGLGRTTEAGSICGQAQAPSKHESNGCCYKAAAPAVLHAMRQA